MSSETNKKNDAQLNIVKIAEKTSQLSSEKSSEPHQTSKNISDGESKSSSSGAYPPMASSAPKPFGAKEKSSSTGGYPPMPGKAPTPFGGEKDNVSSSSKPSTAEAKKAVSSSGGYPPMSAKGPTPFGSGSGSASTKSKSSSSGAYPPIASSAPKPFGAQEKSSSTGGYPPMPGKAPTPFGFEKDNAGSSFHASASTPFGSFRNSFDVGANKESVLDFKVDKSGSLSQSVMRMTQGLGSYKGFSSDKIPNKGHTFEDQSDLKCEVGRNESNFKLAKESILSLSNPVSESTTSASSFVQQSSDDDKIAPFFASSEYESSVWNSVSKFHCAISTLTSKRKTISNSIENSSFAFNRKIGDLIDSCEKIKLVGFEIGEKVDVQKQRLVYFTSQTDDIERQIKESKLLIKRNADSNGISSKSQLLDTESELRRRFTAANAIKTQKKLSCLRDRLVLFDRLFSLEHDIGGNKNFRNKHVSQKYNPSLAANKSLFSALKNGYDRTKQFEAFITNLQKKIEKIPMPVSYTKDKNTSNKKYLVDAVAHSEVNSKGSSNYINRRRKIIPIASSFVPYNKSLSQNPTTPFKNDLFKPSSAELYIRGLHGNGVNVPTKCFGRMNLLNSDKSTGLKLESEWRKMAKSKLMDTFETASQTSSSNISFPIFKSQLSSTGTRTSWSPEIIDATKTENLSFHLPGSKKPIDLNDASSKAFGKRTI